jgi:hypothetical protein
MANPAVPVEPERQENVIVQPPMPSIAASALDESRRLVSLTRRVIAGWLGLG